MGLPEALVAGALVEEPPVLLLLHPHKKHRPAINERGIKLLCIDGRSKCLLRRPRVHFPLSENVLTPTYLVAGGVLVVVLLPLLPASSDFWQPTNAKHATNMNNENSFIFSL